MNITEWPAGTIHQNDSKKGVKDSLIYGLRHVIFKRPQSYPESVKSGLGMYALGLVLSIFPDESSACGSLSRIKPFWPTIN